MILPKKVDIQKAATLERKNMIDEGVALAKRVDDLRQMRLQMEVNFETWRLETSKAIQIEIDVLIKERDELAEEVLRAKELLDKK